jgi:hypothetical protein
MPQAARPSPARVLRPQVIPTSKRQQDPRPLTRHAKPHIPASLTASRLAVGSGGDGFGVGNLFVVAMIAFGTLLLLVAVTPAWLVPPSFTRALWSHHVDLALFGLAIIAVGLTLLAIAR